MLVQSINAIARRFQNIRGHAGNGSAGQPRDRSAAAAQQPVLGLHPGRAAPADGRAAELRVRSRVRPDAARGPRGAASPRTADTRSKFLEAFHNLLHLCVGFYKQDDDTTVIADGFPVLNALKEVHLLLVAGRAQPVRRGLPSTARIEMLMQQWILGRPELREFLPTRIMVAYPEPWMDRVDAMKKIQGWTDTSVLHFRDLARVRRADPAVDPLRRLEQRQRAGCRRPTGRASGGRRSRATSTPTVRSPAST